MILPAILEKKKIRFQKKLNLVAEKVRRVHVDVIEKSFADNQTLLPRDWPKLNAQLDVDVHIMVSQPEKWIEECVSAGGTMLIGHIEKLVKPQGFIDMVIKAGVKAGIAVDLDTEITILGLEKLRNLSQVLLMSIKAGWAGQQFNTKVLDKIKWVRENCGSNAEIVIDGGINLETGGTCLEAGASGLAVNSFLWRDFENNLRKLQELR